MEPSAAPSLSKTADTTARSAPVRITSEEAFAPSSNPSASIRMDFPAPVSPVSKFSPAANSTTTLSMTA